MADGGPANGKKLLAPEPACGKDMANIHADLAIDGTYILACVGSNVYLGYILFSAGYKE